MPLPTPNQEESRSQFMTRCMDSDIMRQEFPEPEQRAAVCSSQWERKDNARARSAWICNALTYPVFTGMLVLVLAGCTAAQDKARIYRDAAERFAVPDKVRICYDREGDVQRGTEHRCFGQGCDLPSCEGDGDGVDR